MPLNVTHTHTSAPSFPHWPKKTSFPNLVAARQHLPALLETPPLWLGNKRMKKEKNRKKKIPPLVSCLGEDGGEIFGLICYCMNTQQ